MLVTGQGPMGGVMTLPDEAKKMGAPPHWLAHVEVGDVDGTVEKAKAKGGKVLVPPMTMPKIGRFGLIADPFGAVISVFKPEDAMTPHDDTKPGEVCWRELVTTDKDAALAFYSELFGWTKTSEMDMGPAGTYTMYGQGEKSYGGMMNKTPDMPMPPMWVYYVQVDDIESAIARTAQKGGKLVFGPQDVPNGRVAQAIDPQGALFAMHGPPKA
jgi:predicted enzyme related to lactoylglutathione lyase